MHSNRKRGIKISKIIETYPETLQEKAECSEGLSPQSDQMDCRILQKRRYPLCGCGRHPKYPQRKRYGAYDQPEVSQPAI